MGCVLEDLPRPVAFLRLDVEGAEGLVLRGAGRLLAADRPVLLVELHLDRVPRISGLDPSSIFDALHAIGYRVHALGARHRVEVNPTHPAGADDEHPQ